MLTSRLSLLALVLMTVGALLAGCKDDNVPYVVDEDEIARAIKESPEGKEIFRSDNLILSDPYTLPVDGGTYRDSVLRSKRAIEVTVGDSAIDYGSYGLIREALARVTDSVMVRTRRVKGVDTTLADQQRVFVRHGIFLKLGSDAQAFVGWVLFGFNGYSVIGRDSATIKMNAPDGSLFFGDNSIYNRHLVDLVGPQYIRLSDIKAIPDGGRIRVEVKAHRRPLLAFKGDNGYQNLLMTFQGNDIYMDTIKTPSSNRTLYNLMVLHLLNDSTGAPTRSGIFIPYRVP